MNSFLCSATNEYETAVPEVPVTQTVDSDEEMSVDDHTDESNILFCAFFYVLT